VFPPLRRRCPQCGHGDWSGRFGAAERDGHRIVVCPACGDRFEPIDQPWLC